MQYLCRLIFTFNYAAMYRRVGSVFGGVSITAIFYFLIMKGAKGSSFMDPGFIKWIDANAWPILAVTFCVLTVIFHVCIRAFKVNLFKLIILAGTFALAFAFAGNDLVNFVGVPLAALDSSNRTISAAAQQSGPSTPAWTVLADGERHDALPQAICSSPASS